MLRLFVLVLEVYRTNNGYYPPFCFNLYASLAVILPRRMCPFRPAKKPSTPGETGKWRDKRIKTRESM